VDDHRWQSVVIAANKQERIWKHSGPFMYAKEGLKVNILLWGFAGTSANAFIREMPRSYSYMVSKLNGFVLRGYNVVGEGAKANVVPLLTGNYQKIT
jgi:hypothetical protein